MWLWTRISGKWWDFVNTGMNLWVSSNMGKFFIDKLIASREKLCYIELVTLNFVVSLQKGSFPITVKPMWMFSILCKPKIKNGRFFARCYC